MKPINEMSLAECLAEVELLNGVYEYDGPALLAKRINELTRWIPLGERMPDEDDGEVLLMYDGGFIQYTPWGFADKEAHTHWRKIDKP